MPKHNSPLDQQVGIYKWGRQGGYYWARAETLRDILTGNTEGKKISQLRKLKGKLRSKFKYTIEAFTPAGDYGKNPRIADGKLLSATHQVQLDFDKQKIDYKKVFKRYSWITAAAPSCGGAGYFFLVNTENKKPYEDYFYALVTFFKDKGLNVDEAVSSVNELRYCGLNEEALVREKPAVWKETKKRPVTPITSIIVKGDGQVVELPASKLGEMHYQDAVPWVAKNNHNGTPIKALVNYVKKIGAAKIFAPESHLNQEVFEELATKMYEKYATQHGEIQTEAGLSLSKTTWIEPIAFDDKAGIPIHQVQIVEEVTRKYSFVYSTKVKQYYKYVGTHWQETERSAIEKFLVTVAAEIGYNAKKSASLKFRKDTFELFTLHTAGQIQTDNTAFNLRNGILVFNDEDKSVKFLDHDPKRMFCYVLDYDYDTKAKAPRFEKFIARVMPDPLDQALFWECIAGAFIHRIKLEYSLFLVGGGETGKSTLLNVIESLFGDACSSFSMRALTSRTDGDRAAREAFKIYNKSIALSRDDTGMSESTLWRKIASREPISVKTLYSNEFETTNYARLVLAVNEKPIIEASHAAQRRLVAIEMSERIKEEEKDYQLFYKLVEERSGILNFLIAGFKRIMKSGGTFTKSAKAAEIKQEIIEASDDVGQWLKFKNILPCGEAMGSYGSIQKRFENQYRGVAMLDTVKSATLMHLFNEDSPDNIMVGSYVQWAYSVNGYSKMRFRKFKEMMESKGFKEYQIKADGKRVVYFYTPK